MVITVSARAARWLGTVRETVLDTVFPPRCAGCGAAGSHFCLRCRGQVEPVPAPWCTSCGESLPLSQLSLAQGVTLCTECAREPLALDGVRSAGRFSGPLRHAVHALKYRGRAAAAPALATLLVQPAAALLAQMDRRDAVVVPVPLHRAREKSRGYNQAAALARPLATATGLAYGGGLLRVRETAPQVGLTRAARRANVRDAFAPDQSASHSLRGRCVLLVDDVTTTGSTLSSAALACRGAGAAAVCAVTLARES